MLGALLICNSAFKNTPNLTKRKWVCFRDQILRGFQSSISKMQKLGFPSVKSLDQFKSLSRSAKSFSFSSRPSTDSLTSGSFANLKLTAGFWSFNYECLLRSLKIFIDFDEFFVLIWLIAEKLVKEQASVKTDLEMAVIWMPPYLFIFMYENPCLLGYRGKCVIVSANKGI